LAAVWITPHRVWIGVDDEEPGGLTLRRRIPVPEAADAGAVVLPGAAVSPESALLLPNDGDFSYCKVRLDPVSRDALATSLGRLLDPLSRAVAALADITALCRDLLSPRPAGEGGDVRLVAGRGLIDSASGPDDTPTHRTGRLAELAELGPAKPARLSQVWRR
jgi:hypothetical protein